MKYFLVILLLAGFHADAVPWQDGADPEETKIVGGPVFTSPDHDRMTGYGFSLGLMTGGLAGAALGSLVGEDPLIFGILGTMAGAGFGGVACYYTFKENKDLAEPPPRQNESR